MGLIAWIFFGLLAGACARCVLTSNNHGRWTRMSFLGALGAVIGGWCGTKAGFGTPDDFDVRSIVTAVAGSIIVLFIYHRRHAESVR